MGGMWKAETEHSNFPTLFSSVCLGPLTLPNRLVMAPLVSLFASYGGEVTSKMVDYYAARARGGVGLITVEATYVEPRGMNFRQQLAADHDGRIPGLSKLAAAIQKEGARASLQLVHYGRIARSRVTGRLPVAPSPIPTVGGDTPQELSPQEIAEVVESFAKAAMRVKTAGFDAVEIHMAHGYLVHSFLSPFSNRRTDEYGGDTEGRTRFAREIIAAVRRLVGPDFPVLAKISGDEYLGSGPQIDITEAAKIARIITDAGLDGITVSGGVKHETGHYVAPPMSVPRGFHVPKAAAIRVAIRKPVTVVGRIPTPELAEEILASGQADLIAMGRALLADPELPEKARGGRMAEICPCIACNYCNGQVDIEVGLGCLANPRSGRETARPWVPAGKKKRVVVVGGGPGGLMAGITAARRGHKAFLLEETDRLGGMLRVAALPPHKEEVGRLVNWLVYEVKRNGVEIRLKHKADWGMIRSFDPDAVILAAGAKPAPLAPGLENENLIFAEEVLEGSVKLGPRVAVIGGGVVGCETAEFLAVRGHQVTLIEQESDVALKVHPRPRRLLVDRLVGLGIHIQILARAQKWSKGCLTMERGELEWEMSGLDHLIMAEGYMPRNELALNLADQLSARVDIIGDARQPRSAAEALREGFEAAYAL